MKRYPAANDRQGVILLVILGLVALFGMVAVSFLLVAGHHRRAAVTQARIGEWYDPPHKLLEEAMYQIIRGTDNRLSAIRHHSLLEDIYGSSDVLFIAHDPRVGVQVQVLAGLPPGSDGQLLAFTALSSFNVQDSTFQPADRPYRFVGRVITAIEGPVAGKTSRIVDYDPNTNSLIALPFEGTSNGDLTRWFQEPFVTNPGNPIPRAIRLLVNGVPFAGTGVGFNGNWNNPRCDAAHPDSIGVGVATPAALLPNPRHWRDPRDPAAPGGANEDYDAVDFQNMLLALQLPQPTGEPFGTVPIPSLHRPELLNYWVHKLVYDWLVNQLNIPPADAWRMVLQPNQYAPPNVRGPIIALWARANLRPLAELHPQFSSTNPALAAWASRDISQLDEQALRAHWEQCPLLRGPWDVDNDGDGLPDSIWVDLGFPVRQTPDGRFYKPLFAIHCIDLDGRLNVNAHGSLAQTTSTYYLPPRVLEAVASGRSFADPVGNPADDVEHLTYARYGVRGSGFGPAEINLLPLFGLDLAAYRELFTGRINPPIEGRYGEWQELFQGRVPQPGVSNAEDPLAANKFVNFPDDYRTFSVPHCFGTPLDYRGFIPFALDIAGHALYTAWQGSWAQWRLDHPYQINLSPNRGRELSSGVGADNPFSPAELERILRPYDADSVHLPSRLASLLGANLPTVRHLVTTDSWDLPVPGACFVRGLTPQSNHPAEIVAARLRAGGCPEPDIPLQLRRMLGPELLAGLRLNLARIFGNRLDDNDNGVVDDFAGESANENISFVSAQGAVVVPLDHDNDGQPGAVEDPRVQLARALYVLAMALTETNVDPPNFWEWFGGPGTDRARFLAQWAINVVDFFDRDSIMTRFAYDPTPFDSDGWSVPAPTDPTYPNWPYVVWGCERPELLITETLAFHDRRTEDLPAFGFAYPPGNAPKEQEQGDQIRDLDQWYRPQGSLFVELYNPWLNHSAFSQLEPVPGEFYPAGSQVVDLAKTAPDGSPVWRLAITPAVPGPNGVSQWNAPVPEPADPDDPRPQERPVLERVVYFTSTPGPSDGAQVIFFSSSGQSKPVVPGGYTMVGPGGPPDGGITYIGFGQGQQQNPNTVRHIVCDPSRNPQFAVNNNGTSPPPGILPVAAVMIDKARDLGGNPLNQRLSVSEPVTGYPDRTDRGDGTTTDYDPNTGKYQHPIDKPLDAQLNPDLWNQVLGRNITVTRFRVVHLQRLADPTRPYDRRLNPYLTIDSMPVDLTSFNGLSTDDDFEAPGEAGSDGTPLQEGPIMFHTRQRGEANDRPDPATDIAAPDRNLWKQEPLTKLVNDDGATIPGNDTFRRQLFHSLGYVNVSQRDGQPIFGLPWDVNDPNSPVYQRQVYAGQPQRPMPWLTWWNRPPVSPYELLLVPTVRSSKLLARREDPPSGPPGQAFYAYYRIVDRDITTSDPQGNAISDARRLNPYEPFQAGNFAPWAIPYPYLGQFFASSRGPSEAHWNLNQFPVRQLSELHRILEFVCVPSPFVGTEIQGNPVAMHGGPHGYHPPNHFLPKYREPGRININTVVDERVWQGLWNSPALGLPREDPQNPGQPNPVRIQFGVDVASGFDCYVAPDNPQPNFASLFARWIQSRRGYGVSESPLEVHPLIPSRFANPLRSFSGAWLTPEPSLSWLVPREVDATLLREHPLDLVLDQQLREQGQNPDPTRPRRPLFETEALLDPNNPNFGLVAWCDTDRNPFFRYRHLMRLANLVTCRSNVYAVWITVGYFEVFPADPANMPGPVRQLVQPDPNQPPSLALIQELYPDGWILGPELGSDTGEVKRHRMFFIFDRSIPVGFRRGMNLNVDKAILVKRFIE